MTDCSCPKCVKCCTKNPGWFSPSEALLAITSGHANRLMLDWLDPSKNLGNIEKIWVLAPSSDNRGGELAPEWDEMHGTGDDSFFSALISTPWKGQCIFLKNNLCEIHYSGFKPIQCVTTFACAPQDEYMDNYKVAKQWDTNEGKSIVEKWKELVKFSQ